MELYLNHTRKYIYFFLLLNGVCSPIRGHENRFHKVYPLTGFKVVVDTCMRAYSDALVLQDRIANHERCDELLDLLVGRLIRLQSYIEQLIYAYKYEATVSFDEIEYLIQMIDYLELTLSDHAYKDIACSLNNIANHLKKELKQTLGLVSCSLFMPVQLPPSSFRPSINPLHRFA